MNNHGNYASSAPQYALEHPPLPAKDQPRWDVYLQEDGTAAICLGGTRTYYEALLATLSHNLTS